VVVGSAIKAVVILLALLLGGVAHANPLVDKLVGEIEASPAACGRLPAANPYRRQIEALVATMQARAEVPAGTRFEVLDCDADGFVYRGQTVVLSDRLVRLNDAQRFFIVAHELGHVVLGHHADMARFVAGLVGDQTDETAALARVQANLRTISHQHENAADAFAVRTMLAAGYDPEQAARLFDSIDDPTGNSTHPSARARAAAIRRTAAALRQAAGTLEAAATPSHGTTAAGAAGAAANVAATAGTTATPAPARSAPAGTTTPAAAPSADKAKA
jgi:Zn-dependent protease with chaperone function